jgi:hypothetical protein
MMEKIAEKTFIAGLIRERSIVLAPEQLGEHESTMTLYKTGPAEFEIEWDIPDLEETWNIGIWTDENKVVIDYDGLFSLPAEAIQLLNENGFDTREIE